MTTKEVAVRLGLSTRQITNHIKKNNLEGEKIGRDYHIDEKAIEAFEKNRPRRGRRWPEKSQKNVAKDRKNTNAHHDVLEGS